MKIQETKDHIDKAMYEIQGTKVLTYKAMYEYTRNQSSYSQAIYKSILNPKFIQIRQYIKIQ